MSSSPSSVFPFAASLRLRDGAGGGVWSIFRPPSQPSNESGVAGTRSSDYGEFCRAACSHHELRALDGGAPRSANA